MTAGTIRASAHPLSDINTTPLIDVLLVLLIMLVLTLPIAPHALEIGLPVKSVGVPVDAGHNRLVVTQNNAILWNGEPLTRAELSNALAQVRTTRPEPEVQFEPEALASYDLSANVLNQVKQAHLTNFGIAGSERYRKFERD